MSVTDYALLTYYLNVKFIKSQLKLSNDPLRTKYYCNQCYERFIFQLKTNQQVSKSKLHFIEKKFQAIIQKINSILNQDLQKKCTEVSLSD